MSTLHALDGLQDDMRCSQAFQDFNAPALGMNGFRDQSVWCR